MQRTHNRHVLHHQGVWSTGNFRLLQVILFLMAALLLLPSALPAVLRAAGSFEFLLDADSRAQPPLLRGPTLNSRPPVNREAVAFEQTARQLAADGSNSALDELVHALNRNGDGPHRVIVLRVLKDAPAEIDSLLIAALDDPDEAVRAGAAQALGLRRDYQAIAALDAATRDSRAWVRSEAARSLGEIEAWQDLPRLNQLQASDPSPIVYAAARAAVTAIRKRIAAEIGLLDSQLVDVSVSPSSLPRVYAVSQDNLYVRNGAGWEIAGPVPDIPVALAASSDRNLIYLATVHLGLYTSPDDGATWQHLQFGSNSPRPVMVTALAASPEMPRRVYAALATPGSKPGQLNPFDIVTSSDGGNSWVSLPDPPLQALTTHLYIDPEAPGYLLGLSDDTPWRYRLPGE